MPSPELVQQRHMVATLLQRARDGLIIPSGELWRRVRETLAEVDGYITRNELELALNRLEDAAQQVTGRSGFWRDMERAAQAMNLNDRAQKFRTQFLAAKKAR